MFGVHGVGGFVGTVLAGVFAAETFGGNQAGLAIGRQFGIQLGAALGVTVYTAVATWAILKGIAAVTPLRVDNQGEDVGLDVTLHDEAGYRY